MIRKAGRPSQAREREIGSVSNGIDRYRVRIGAATL